MRIKTNSTGSMSRELDNFLIDEEGILQSKTVEIYYSYQTVVGYRLAGQKPVFCKNVWTQTTAQHLSKYRDEFGLDKGDQYEPEAFITRAFKDLGEKYATHILTKGYGALNHLSVFESPYIEALFN